MKELEKQILACCLHEDKYKEVSFLEAKDFTDYPDAPCKSAWAIIAKNKGKDIYTLDAMKEVPENVKYWMYSLEFSVVGYMKHRNFSLYLLETRFKRLLADLLSQLSVNTKNALERELLNESLLAVTRQDIFDLSDNLLEYLGHHASDNTKGRISAFLNYRDKRANEAKSVFNEHR